MNDVLLLSRDPLHHVIINPDMVGKYYELVELGIKQYCITKCSVDLRSPLPDFAQELSHGDVHSSVMASRIGNMLSEIVQPYPRPSPIPVTGTKFPRKPTETSDEKSRKYASDVTSRWSAFVAMARVTW